ncbi:MAG: response regulator transcription factor [Cellvibrionales bacterium]|jgi:DNA-binding response OmpR family regulator
MIRVLIVEDDEIIAEELSEVFGQWGFDATAVLTVGKFWEVITELRPQVVVVDLTLPDGSGADIIRDIRSQSDIGIIVISGRSDEIERVACIEMGADDYLCKPFSTREMVARIRQLIYRTGGIGFGEGGRKATPESGRFGFAGHTFDVHSMSLSKADGEEIPLTTLEYAVLKTLVTHSRQVLSREFLLESVHSADWVGSDRNVDNLVSRIRKKLTSEDGTALVKTVRGAGYMFSSEVEAL